MRKATYTLDIHPALARIVWHTQMRLDVATKSWRNTSEWYHLHDLEDQVDDIKVLQHLPKVERAASVVEALVKWLDTSRGRG